METIGLGAAAAVGSGLGLMSAYATVEGLVITFYYPREIGTDRINLSLTDGQWTVYTMLEV